VLILRDPDLAKTITIQAAIEAVRSMLLEQAAGGINLPSRVTASTASGSKLWILPAVAEQAGFLCFKFMNLVPLHGIRYLTALASLADGRLLALLDAKCLTTLRTSATAAVATDLLAPTQVSRMGLLGSGNQAGGLIHAMTAVRKITRIDVYSPNPTHRQAFCTSMSDATGLEIKPSDAPSRMIRECDLICSAYQASAQPMIIAEDLLPSAHLNCLSSTRENAREVENRVWSLCSQIAVDDRSAVSASGDGRSVALEEGFDLQAIPELCRLQGNACQRSREGVTMYKSAGSAAQDLAIAILAYRTAIEQGIGEDIGEFPSLRPR
jgi:alanine dehydrogenase